MSGVGVREGVAAFVDCLLCCHTRSAVTAVLSPFLTHSLPHSLPSSRIPHLIAFLMSYAYHVSPTTYLI